MIKMQLPFFAAATGINISKSTVNFNGSNLGTNQMNISEKNFTEAIDDPIEDVYETETVVKYIHYIFLICTLVTFVCALAAKIFLVVTILRFKELRTRINMYIFNATNLPYEATKTVYCLTVANIFVLSWLPHFVLHYFLLIGFHAQWHVTLLITGLFGYASPVVVVWILGRKNKHFKMAYNRSFKRSLSIYQNGNLDVSDDEECKTEDQIVRVHMNAEDVSIY
ncbi:unnamed protein product [Brassicogethes aeneus]|uniref:Uncharacterized protein n=1 Tax=Brassicogethes aeneus TaxID=1431903 RepID=A0A9P0FIE6_BRAAE|nr:unnamed protein product [Brassicogethes aeneus]